MTSQASTSMARMWPSRKAKKVGLASNSFMSLAAWCRARKSSTSWACRGEWPVRRGGREVPVTPEIPRSHSAHTSPKGCGQRGQRDKSTWLGSDLDCCLVAKAPRQRVGGGGRVRKKQKKAEWAKPLKHRSSKSSLWMGVLGPEQGGRRLGTSADPASSAGAVGSWQACPQPFLQLPACQGRNGKAAQAPGSRAPWGNADGAAARHAPPSPPPPHPSPQGPPEMAQPPPGPCSHSGIHPGWVPLGPAVQSAGAAGTCVQN